MKKLQLFLLFFPIFLTAQEVDFWNDSDHSFTESSHWKSTKGAFLALNEQSFSAQLKNAESRKGVQISIPYPDGSLIDFWVNSTDLLAPELQEKFPDIKTFKGYNKKGELVRLDITSLGIHASVYTIDQGMIYLSPVDRSKDEYISYYVADYSSKHQASSSYTCEVGNHKLPLSRTRAASASFADNFVKRTVGAQRRLFKVALASHKTFTDGVGGVEEAMSAMTVILNRAATVYGREVAIDFELIANNDLLIKTDADPGPFLDNFIRQRVIATNHNHINEVIGAENYDFGHIFGIGDGGGLATLGSVCNNNTKGRGASGLVFLRNDDFAQLTEIFIHEVGHQFNATHTFTAADQCTAGAQSWDKASSYELGGGVTYMSFAGNCGDSPESRRLDYFHTISSSNIMEYLERPTTCHDLVETGNTPPSVQVQESGFTIPVNTPFALEATGTDEDGDDLTYSWEQFDLAVKIENVPGHQFDVAPFNRYFSVEEFLASDDYETREEMEAEGVPENIIQIKLRVQDEYIEYFFEGDGPLFRNFLPTTSNKRYFPEMSKVLAGETSIQESRFEVLPFKTRELNFVVTVRDNSSLGGGMTNDIVSFSSTEDAGPFVVTTELSETSYNGLSNVLLEWDVADTNEAPVSCAQVDILYSSDGGESFDITLAERTENDGSETIRLPNLETDQARIMIKASDNIFFNVNDRNFSVTPSEVAAPEAVTSLTAVRTGIASVNLDWTDNSDVEDGFIIERRLNEEVDFEELARVALDVTQYEDETADEGESYSYRVAAFNVTGNSAYSNTVTVEGTALGFEDTSLKVYPNPVSNALTLIVEQESNASLLDLQGKQVLPSQIGTSFQFDLESLNTGVYVLKITTGSRTVSRKIIKEN